MTERAKRLILAFFLLAFFLFIPLIAIVTWNPSGRPVAGDSALLLEIGGEMLEHDPAFSPSLFLGRRELTLTSALGAIDAGARDESVKALVVKILPSGAGAAKCEELASAIDRFRKSGKSVVAFSPVLTGHHYLVACAADSIFMPPAGYVVIPGPASSAVFLRGTFDKLGITPNIDRIGDYKSAAEMYTEKARTPQSKEMTEWLLGDIFEQYVSDIAEARGRGADAVLLWIDRGLYSPARALSEGIIDDIRYWDEVEATFADRDLDLVPALDYLRTRRASLSLDGARVAVIHAQGLIVMGESGFDPVSGLTMGSETVIDELRKVRDDKSIKAVILRVDSPGGDGIAGDMISREVELTSSVKPVVVSMSDVAASGGYEIAYRADRIVAMPGSLTGSIGSITGKLNMRGLYDKIGITKDEIGTGNNSLIYSDYRDFSEEEWKLVREEHWQFYHDWIGEIARCRGMTVGAVDSLGRGRVWTGAQAAKNRLIDGIGGLNTAVALACELADIADSSRVVLIHYPKRVNLFQEILSRNLFEDAAAYAVHRALAANDAPETGLLLRHLAPVGKIR